MKPVPLVVMSMLLALSIALTDAPAIQPATATQPATQPSKRAAERAEMLKKGVKHFWLQLKYYGEEEKPPCYHLFLSVTRLQAPPTLSAQLDAQITEDQAKKIIDYLAIEGCLDRATVHETPAKPFEPPRPTYVLYLSGDYWENLGWGVPMLQRLDGLRTVLDGDAAKNVDLLLERLAGDRKEWEKQAATQPTRSTTQPAVSAKTREIVERYIDDARATRTVDDQLVLALPPGEAVACLGEFVRDPSSQGNWAAKRAIMVIITKQDDLRLRQQGLAILLPVACEDDWLAKNLLKMPVEQFPADAKEQVTKALAAPSASYGTALLAGYLGMESAKDRLREIAKPRFDGTDRTGDQEPRWAAVLALARLGDADGLRFVVKRVENEKDTIKRGVFLVDDLVYVGRPETVRLLVDNVTSSKRLPKSDLAPLGEPIGARSLGPLARLIEGFPIAEKKDYKYTQDDLVKARAWLMEQKRLKLKGSNEEVDLK